MEQVRFLWVAFCNYQRPVLRRGVSVVRSRWLGMDSVSMEVIDMGTVYIVTNAISWHGLQYDQTFETIKEAQECAERINRLASRGLCKFAEIIEV